MKRLLQFFYYPGPPSKELCRVLPSGAPSDYRLHFHTFGLLANWRAAWVGAHYSKQDKRLCVNLLPFVTIWWAQPGGRCP